MGRVTPFVSNEEVERHIAPGPERVRLGVLALEWAMPGAEDLGTGMRYALPRGSGRRCVSATERAKPIALVPVFSV